MKIFSYDEYKFIIKNLKKYIPLLDYTEVNVNTKRFCIIRHDVEFSTDRAYNLAKLEHEKLNIHTTYFFQLRNNSYNMFSQKNIQLIKKIFNMGHKIGLHVHFGGLYNFENENRIKEYIKNDIEIMKRGLETEINRFSCHRPPKELLAMNIKINGIINAYDKLYFHYYAGRRPKKLNVYYTSDSQHRWDYSHPIELIKNNLDKMQILMHPYSWSEEGYSSHENFSRLLGEKMIEIKSTINNECKHFLKSYRNKK